MLRFTLSVAVFLLACGKLASTEHDGYCFRYRNPIGERGKCQGKIEKTPESAPAGSAADCCLLGGAGWAEKPNGRRCTDACKDVNASRPVEPDQMESQQANGEEEAAPDAVENYIANGIDKVEGVWSRWSEWQPCSVTCGTGFRERRRYCNPPSGQPDENVQCPGDRVQHMPCNSQTTCPVHGQWGQWTGWSECSATCGDTMARYRECDSPAPEHGGNACTAGKDREVRWCYGRRNCPIDGGWGHWSAWAPCSVTCGRQGQRKRFRTCTEPTPIYGGLDCAGDSIRTRLCKPTAHNCPVDGGWSEWGNWKCLPECANGGHGLSIRTRQCSNPKPADEGRFCNGQPAETRPCSETECPVDGGWSSWTGWGDCSSSCGEYSYRSRKRLCNNPKPRQGGLECIDEGFQTKDCNLDPCPDTSESSLEVESVTPPPCDDEDYWATSGEGGSGCQVASSEVSSEVSSEISSLSIDSPDYTSPDYI